MYSLFKRKPSINLEQTKRVMKFSEDCYRDFCTANRIEYTGTSCWLSEDTETGEVVVESFGDFYYSKRSLAVYVRDVQRLYNLSDTELQKIMSEYPSIEMPVSTYAVEKKALEEKTLREFLGRPE